MGELLKEVKSTNDKGLIGITEDGVEVPLSAPKPCSTYIHAKLKRPEDFERMEQQMSDMIKKADEGCYFQLGKLFSNLFGTLDQAYNIFTKRE